MEQRLKAAASSSKRNVNGEVKNALVHPGNLFFTENANRNSLHSENYGNESNMNGCSITRQIRSPTFLNDASVASCNVDTVDETFKPSLFTSTPNRNLSVALKDQSFVNTTFQSSVSVPTNNIKIIEEGSTIHVCYTISTVEIWCRLLCTEESVAFEKMDQEMQKVYNEYRQNVLIVNIGKCYVTNYKNRWSRIKIVHEQNDNYICFFLDHGNEDLIPKRRIYALWTEFATIPAQSFLCALNDLEELEGISCSWKHLQQLNCKDFLVLPNINQLLTPNSSSVFMVTLYDTSGKIDVNMNKKIKKEIVNDPEFSLLENNNKFNKVYVTHVESDGIIYVQIKNKIYLKFLNLVKDLKNKNSILLDNKNFELYVVKWSKDKQFHRCKILDRSPDNHYTQIYFVDTGVTDIVNIIDDTLFPLESMCDELVLIPYQAVKIKINKDFTKLPENFTEKLLSLLPKHQIAMLKILEFGEDGIPICELYKHSENEGVFISINSALKLESEYWCNKNLEFEDKTRILVHKLERLKMVSLLRRPKFLPSYGNCSAPFLPKINEIFDIRVASITSPSNFYVQPLKSYSELEKLMENIQNHYRSVTRSDVDFVTVLPARMFACRYEDGVWYRVNIVKVIHSGSISVYYCDYGYYANVMIKNLVHLSKEFLKLPAQAMKARIKGIKPKREKWHMEDCQKFKKLFLRNNFKATLLAIKNDEIFQGDIIFDLKIYDKDNSDIIDRLVNYSIAIYE